MTNKYNNRKVEIDGHIFDSVKESKRYEQLKTLLAKGEIENLQLQVPFVIRPGFRSKDGHKYRDLVYKADFVYYKNGAQVVEDVKSIITKNEKVYKIKKRLMEQDKGIYITEVM